MRECYTNNSLMRNIVTTIMLITFCFSVTSAQEFSGINVLVNGLRVTNDMTPAEWQKAGTNEIKYPAEVLMKFRAIPTTEVKALLKKNGVHVHQYIGDRTFIASIEQKQNISFLSEVGIVRLANVLPVWKVSNGLTTDLQSKDEIEVNVLLKNGVSSEELLPILSAMSGKLVDDNKGAIRYCRVAIPGNKLLQLAVSDKVSYISEFFEDKPLNSDAKAATRMRVAAAPIGAGGYALDGSGVTIGVGDNTSGIFHVDLSDRVINYNPYGYTNHGVHINGITGGAGIVDPKGEGMATSALLCDLFFSDVLDRTPDIFQQHNVTVTNNSYSATRGSCEYAGTYDALAAGLDQLCLDYPLVFQVFAAANDGLFDCSPYPTGFATIAGGYQPAKNIIVVASTDKAYVNADNSSRGPVRDGRLKPEISAVGVDVNSTTKNDEYLVASGTSMASPQVAGAAALLTQRMTQINGTTQPRSDVLKALLINGSTDIGIKGPDYRFGFGFLNVERSLIMLDSARYITATINNNAVATHNIQVPAGMSKLKVALYWHDVPANPMAEKQLVNDLDLEVAEPSGTSHKPLILDPTPANINNPAVEGVDRLNNIEQVVIDNPAAGTYTVTVKGFSLPSDTRDYVLAYDFLPDGISIKYPIQDAQVMAGDSLYTYWDASEGTSQFVFEFSTNDGATWNTAATGLDADARFFRWPIPDTTNSAQCKVRITRGADVATSGTFVINQQPQVSLSTVQCPGYISISWPPVSGATAYHVLRNIGGVMVSVDTTADTTYVFSGMSVDSTYYVSVRPVINGKTGYRAIAVKRKPSDGNCAGTISDGDLMVEKISAPLSGRMFTQTQLTANEKLVVHVRNLDDQAYNNYSIVYSVNNGSWQTSNFADVLPAVGKKAISISGLDLSAPGDYHIRVAVVNTLSTDNVAQNDTIDYYVSQLLNDPVSLPFEDGFETLPVLAITRDTSGISTGMRWDYKKNTDTGRLSTRILPGTIISGNRSLSLDAYRSMRMNNYNTLTATFNLAAYDAAKDEVRLEFDYIVHGRAVTEPGNEVTGRGIDTKSKEPIFKYKLNRESLGIVNNSGSISLSDYVLSQKDNFSTSTQVTFGQNDTSLIGGRNVGNGITVDNVKLYTVQNDIQLLEIINPESLICGTSGSKPLIVKIRNGVSQPQNNVKINYRIDGGLVQAGVLNTIGAKETIEYTFSESPDLSASGKHILDVWVEATGDTYNNNDSILQYEVRSQPLITSFPYFEDFEQGDGYWYAEGINSSWEYGTPTAPKISAAASGKNAWVTNLDGDYNDDELSYLYSPCFDISGLDTPVLSFKLALDIENCDFILCDAGYMDYSIDGENWERLGDYGKGVNWYNDSNYLSWTLEDRTVWQHAEIDLPVTSGNIRFRYGLHTDPGATKEGLGVDDIKIYNRRIIVPSNEVLTISPNPAIDGIVNIEWAALAGTEMKVVVTDIMGKVAHSTAAIAQEGYNKTTITAPVLAPGIYFMRITIADKEYTHKIVFTRS